MDEVLHDLPDDHEGDGSPLLVREAVHRRGYLLEVVAHVARLYDHHARGGRGVVVDGDARWVMDLAGRGALLRRVLLAVLFHKRVEVPRHRPSPFLHLFIGCRKLFTENSI